MSKPDFITFGYFPEELPPSFSTSNFGNYCNKNKLTKYLPKSDFQTPTGVKSTNRTRLARYNASKRGRNRREFSLPNPISFHDTCFFLSRHWKQIDKFLSKSKNVSFSTPEVDGEIRAIKFTPHAEIPAIKLLTLGGYKFVLQSDISRFYNSIYTHSLPWAFHGKLASKKDTSTQSTKNYFNKIDEIIRNGQDGQTIGLPIGTDCSRVLAEVISVAIDLSFTKANPNIKFLRHVDDVWFGARSDNEAKKTLAKYRVELRGFELDINDLKTNIRSFSFLTADKWPQKLRNLADELKPFFPTGRELDTFIQFYSYAFETANKQNDEAIIKYSIKLLDTNEMWNHRDLWPYLEKYLAACAINFPHSIDYVAQIISWKKRTNKDFDKKLWVRIFNSIIAEHAPRQNDHEVSWALWALWDLEIKVEKR